MRRFLILPMSLLLAQPALAHHPLGDAAPQTLIEGLLSGLAHPVIGLDHLAFVVLAGIAAALAGIKLPGFGWTGFKFTGAASFVAATVLGTLVHLAGIELPLAELVIAGSVVVLGLALLAARQVSGPLALVGFALAGLFHGWAYGEAVVGSEMVAVGAYLAGFGAIQTLLAWGVALLTARALAVPEGVMTARIAAAVCLGIGLTFAFDTVEGLILG